MSFSNHTQDESDTFVKPPLTTSTKSPVITASGYCDKCHNRYYDVEIINGVPQCQTCFQKKHIDNMI